MSCLGKPYFEFEVDRDESARYGMTTEMVNEIVAVGLGGVNVTNTVEGRERYPVQVRFRRDIREQVDLLGKVPVVTPSGDMVPLERLLRSARLGGLGMINSEDSRLVAHVMFSPSGIKGDIETVDAAMKSLTNARATGHDRRHPGIRRSGRYRTSRSPPRLRRSPPTANNPAAPGPGRWNTSLLWLDLRRRQPGVPRSCGERLERSWFFALTISMK